jgi:hypothetical protein
MNFCDTFFIPLYITGIYHILIPYTEVLFETQGLQKDVTEKICIVSFEVEFEIFLNC